ncbi:MAG: FtsQ-type POTRA domain-containing protein [Bryobacteraceae bacterium]
MGRRDGQAKAPVPHNWVRLIVWGCVFAGVAWGAREAQSYLLRDPQFDFQDLQIGGTRYTNRARIQTVFVSDTGKSIFQIPVAERRRHLLAIDWVLTASVTRVWPNRIVVRVTERTPVAFARLPLAGTVRHWLALIDDDGVLLSIPPKVRFRFPVLNGVTEDQTDEDRRVRVRTMEHLLSDLGPQAKDISEVNCANAQEVRVIADVDGQAVELWLGDRHFRSRYLNFVSHYGDIRKHSERAGVFDLRLDDRILAR